MQLAPFAPPLRMHPLSAVCEFTDHSILQAQRKSDLTCRTAASKNTAGGRLWAVLTWG
jgi:hypothetical protein